MADAGTRLRDGLRAGDRDGVVAALLDIPPHRRPGLRGSVRRHGAAVAAAPLGTRREPDWNGALRLGHQSAATAAVLGCSTVAQAVRLSFTGVADARDLPRALFPADLDAFAEAWATRFLRDPKAWDRNRGVEAMFEWAQEGLVAPLTHPGAVLLLAAGSHTGDGVECLRYLEARPVLVDTTLRLVFEVEGIPGASPAQRDASRAPGTRLVDFVVPELVRRGHWTLGFARNGASRVAASGWPAFQRRWFSQLDQNLRRTEV